MLLLLLLLSKILLVFGYAYVYVMMLALPVGHDCENNDGHVYACIDVTEIHKNMSREMIMMRKLNDVCMYKCMYSSALKK